MKKLLLFALAQILFAGLFSQQTNRMAEIEVSNAAGDSVAAISVDEDEINLNAQDVLINGMSIAPGTGAPTQPRHQQ